MKKTLILVGLAVIAIGFAFGISIYRKATNTNNAAPVVRKYSKIEVYSTVAPGEQETKYGELTIVDNKIVYKTEKVSILDAYIVLHKNRWEAQELGYDTESQDANGNRSYGTKLVRISDPDFLAAIYMELNDEFDGFRFTLD